MGWATLAGLGLSAAGSYTSGQANNRAAMQQANDLSRYQSTYSQLSDADAASNASLVGELTGLSKERNADYASLGDALASGKRGEASDASRADYQSRLEKALGLAPTQANTSAFTGATGGQAAFDAASAPYAHLTNATKALSIDTAGRNAETNYDLGAYRKLREQETDIARRSGEAQGRATLSQAQRQRMLGDAAVRDRWQGPGAGYYNTQLMAQAMQLGGSGLTAYGASRQGSSSDPGGYSNSTTVTNRPQGPSQYQS